MAELVDVVPLDDEPVPVTELTGPVDRAHLRTLALRTLFPGFLGTAEPPPWLADLVAEGLGGVVLFARNVDPAAGDAGVRELTAVLRRGRPDLLVAVDEEGGDVTRLDATTGSRVPGSAALGAVDDPALTRDVAAALGARLRACGIDLNFAPVADVDVDPLNPIVGVRAFGSDPQLVARHVAAFVEGQQTQRVAATAKHFPGHGATDEDSHVTLPTVEASREVLEARELLPFRAAVAAGVRAVMTAHLLVPALDPTGPATLSAAVVTGVLREQLGFDGVVFTDGLDMHAISRTVGLPEGTVRALVAGVDAICVGGDTVSPETLEAMVGAVVAAVEEGRLPYARLASAAQRVRRLAAWSGASAAVDADGGAVDGDGGPTPEAWQHAARRAVRAVGDVVLPGPPLVLQLEDVPSIAAGVVPWGVGAPLAARLPDTVVVPVSAAGAARVGDVIAAHGDRPVVVAVRGVRRHAWQAEAVAAVRALRPDVVVVDHELPSAAEVLGPRHVLVHGASLATAEAAADLLTGRLPGGPGPSSAGR